MTKETQENLYKTSSNIMPLDKIKIYISTIEEILKALEERIKVIEEVNDDGKIKRGNGKGAYITGHLNTIGIIVKNIINEIDKIEELKKDEYKEFERKKNMLNFWASKLVDIDIKTSKIAAIKLEEEFHNIFVAFKTSLIHYIEKQQIKINELKSLEIKKESSKKGIKNLKFELGIFKNKIEDKSNSENSSNNDNGNNSNPSIQPKNL